MAICPGCGGEFKSLHFHTPHCKGDGNVAVAERPAPAEPRSQRGRSRHLEAILRPIDQIPLPPGGGAIEATGAWAYYLRADGATISDALVLYPNGGIPEMDDPRMAARYGENAYYYRERQARRGLEYIGQTLTEQGVRKLVAILEANRDDEILFCEDEIENCKTVIASADRPEIRDQARRRQRQFSQRLDYLCQPLDPEGLTEELNEIARAQMLAKVDPNVLRVMRSMIGEVNDRMAQAIGKFQAGRSVGEGAPARMSRAGSDATVFDATGRDHLEA